jgi:hypothetical protein
MGTPESLALEVLALELGVSISTLAQYADGVGSYGAHHSHSSPRRRKLPPRGSVEGNLLAARIRRVAGTDNVRGVVRKK